MYIIVQHKVRDYDSWKPAFDDHESVRAKYGCKGHTVFRGADDPNDITILMEWESRERADEFMRDPSLAEAMQRGGVASEPRATALEQADTTRYPQRQAA